MAYSVSMFEIEKDIPVVARNRTEAGFSKAVRDALSQMEKGDSFAYTDETEGKNQNRAVRHIARQLEIKVTVRDLGEGKFRVWKLT